jgi:ABC-type Fe3+-hydroxamate transport system substrate-binding protein
MPSRSLLSVLTVLVAVLISGCGGAKSLPPAQSKLIAEADPICASASAKRAEANKRLGGVTSLSSPTTLASIAETAPGVSTYENEAVAKLRKLTAPTSIATDWQSMLAGLQQLAKATGQLGAYAKEKNVTAAEKLLTSTKATREQLLTIATRDGFANCGRAD